jgi:type IV pilus assembly protein PilO
MKGIGKILIFLAISVVLVVLYIFLLHTKTSKTIQDLRRDYSTVSDSLSKARQIANRLPETQRDYDFLKKQWVHAQGMLPTERETEHLLSIISKAATENNMKITSFKPGALTSKANFQEYPLKIIIVGKYHSTGKFFSDLGNLKRIIRIGDIKMQFRKDVKAVETTFTATSYVYKGLRDEGTKKGKKGGKK